MGPQLCEYPADLSPVLWCIRDIGEEPFADIPVRKSPDQVTSVGYRFKEMEGFCGPDIESGERPLSYCLTVTDTVDFFSDTF